MGRTSMSFYLEKAMRYMGLNAVRHFLTPLGLITCITTLMKKKVRFFLRSGELNDWKPPIKNDSRD